MKNAARKWMTAAAVLSAVSASAMAATSTSAPTSEPEPIVMLAAGASLIAIGLIQRRRAA